MQTKVSSRGQTAIPAQIRKKYGINGNSKLQWIDQGEIITVVPISEDPIKAFRGGSKNKDIVKELLEDRKKERERDE
jgi:AbrB family looped-hinge helix DNA binding protein